jgi:hypothetical protein
MASTGLVIHSMTSHHLIFQTFPEIFKRIFWTMAFKYKGIFNNYVVGGRVPLDFQTWDSIERLLAHYSDSL